MAKRARGRMNFIVNSVSQGNVCTFPTSSSWVDEILQRQRVCLPWKTCFLIYIYKIQQTTIQVHYTRPYYKGSSNRSIQKPPNPLNIIIYITKRSYYSQHRKRVTKIKRQTSPLTYINRRAVNFCNSATATKKSPSSFQSSNRKEPSPVRSP